VVTDVVAVGSTDTVGLKTVVDLGVALDCKGLILGEDSAYLKDAPCAPLAELTVTGGYGFGFAFNGHSYSSTCTLGRPHHYPNIA
jgi:hypothetical protein